LCANLYQFGHTSRSRYYIRMLSHVLVQFCCVLGLCSHVFWAFIAYTESSRKNATILNYDNYVNYYLKIVCAELSTVLFNVCLIYGYRGLETYVGPMHKIL
jgi:hypothetical protein